MEIVRERLGKNNPIASETVKEIKIVIIFAKERAKIEIYNANEKIWRIPSIIIINLLKEK